MKNKLLLLSLLVVPFGMSVTSCKEEHTYHVWEKSWTFDEESHWLKCSKCDATNFKSAHQFDDGVITTAPTKTADGVKTFKCEMCGYEKTETVTFEDAHIHSWNEGEVTTPATETEDGVKTYTCSTCGETKTETIPKTGNNGGTLTTTEVDGFVMVDSIDDVDNLYIVSSSDGISYNCLTNETKIDSEGKPLPWYFKFVTTDFDLTKNGITNLEEGAELYTFKKQTDGSFTVQTSDGKYLYSYIDSGHYSISLCDTTQADKNGTVFWKITKDGKGFIVKGFTLDVYLSLSAQSFCGYKEKPSFPIYFFKPGKVTLNNNGGNTGDGNDEFTGTIAEDSRWNLNFNEYGYTFRDTLAGLMKSKVTAHTSYHGTLSIGMGAAAAGNGYFVPFYHKSKYSVTEKINREHTWPNSRGGGSNTGGDEIEEDPYMVRPTLTSENSDRKNYFYGIGSSQWDPASCEFEAARGESARVIFYVATKFGKSHGLSLSNNPSDDQQKKTMGTLKYLIEWNRNYPVTDMEKQINNNLEKAGFGRNPFVDHPEYAEFIWNKNGVQTSVPNIDVGGSGSGSGSSSGTGESGGGGQDVPPTPTYDYSLITDVNSLDGKTAYIVSSKDGGSYYAMTDEAKSTKEHFYIKGVSATLSADKSSCNIDSGVMAYKFEKQSDGSYTICTSNETYLYNYIDGSHNSITLSDTTKGTKYWTITKEGDGFVVKSSTLDVYLEFYDNRFCGYKSKPSVPIYLYNTTKADATV